MLINLFQICAGWYSCVLTIEVFAWIPHFSLAETDSLVLLGAGLAAVAALMRRKRSNK